jgi:hypothetical protein
MRGAIEISPEQYAAELEQALNERIAAERDAEAARRAALTPEARQREDRAAADLQAHMAANWEKEKARRAEREREYWAKRNDPYSTFGT